MSEAAGVGDIFRFTTDGMTAADASDTYRGLYATGADAVVADDFRASMTSRWFFRMTVHDRRLHGVGHRREDDRVRHDDFSHFTATLCLAGTLHGSGTDGFRRIHPGEMLLLDMTRPTATQLNNAHILTISLAREVVEGISSDARRLHGQVLDQRRAAPLLRYFKRLAAGSPIDAPSGLPIEAVAALLRGAIDPVIAESDRRRRAQRLFAARAIVEQEFSNPDLDATHIARRLNLSRATLYRLFEPFGGVGHYILQQRLLRLRRLLAGRGSRGFSTMTDELGLASESHASRAFLDRFGQRPGRFRRAAHKLDDAAYATLCMTLWQNDLR